ncbi:hypothetical protein ACQ4PT_000222 [Festuca glaucescens]
MQLQKAAAVNEDKPDRLSKLPKDVLLNILERVDTFDAIRTCILSKRMQNLPSMLSQIVLVLSTRDLIRMNGVVADVTDRILQTRAPEITIRMLKLRFILRLDDCLSIGKSVALSMATQKLDAAEFEISTQTVSEYCTKANMLYFAKQFNMFIGDCPDAFAGLTRLHLQNMRFREPDIHNILSTCKRLESLHLFQCDAGIHSVLQVEHVGLVELDITFALFRTIDLQYDTWSGFEIPLVLGFVPQLSKLNPIKKYTLDKTLVLRDLLANVPSISELHLDFGFFCGTPK